ncbi:MAG: RtcB family protein, partial [Candidatus Nanoarchaeia archaeon]|nr:RtcB family protein [Candidatus Nanoarchaeia archaeon]
MKVYNDNTKVHIKSWCNNPEDGAIEQAKNLANLPFVYKHVALMSDCHQGYGMPIGGVIACEDTIIPNAVGVDIGCFTGDTEVALLNGENKNFKQLYDDNQVVWVYSLDDYLNIVPAKAIPLKTKQNAKLLKITISGGFSIKCTPDHLFMLNDGSYKKAEELKPFDSLMPLYRFYQTRDGYEFCHNGKNKGKLTHKLIAEYCYGIQKNKVVHHKNKNWFDNTPENLEYLTPNEHNKLHRKNDTRFKNNEFKTKRIQTLKEKGFYSKDLLPKKQKIAMENLSQAFKSEKWEITSKQAGQRNKEFLKKFNEINNKTEYTCEKCGRKILGKGGLARHMKFCQQNHKVLKIITLDYVEDVYCLNVDKFHNFALAAGIFVHNCGMAAVKTSLTSISTERLKEIMTLIRKKIPVGFNRHSKMQDENLMPHLDPENLWP